VSVSQLDAEHHPHLLLARRLWEAVAAGDAAVLRDVLSEKTVWRMPGRSPLAGTYAGVEAVIGFLARIGELTDDLRSDLIDIYVNERGAVMHYAVSAQRGVHSLETEQLFLIHVDQGKVGRGLFVPVDPRAYDAFFTPQ
jgi:ketosteroid isomerase-like protein